MNIKKHKILDALQKISWSGFWRVWFRSEMITGILAGKPKGKRDHLQDLGMDGSIILIYLLNEMEWRGLDLPVFVQEELAGCCEYGNELCDSIKCGNFLSC